MPYLDVEKLSRQFIEKHFRRLRYVWVWTHSRATLTLFEDRFQLDFPDSRTSIECAIDPNVVAWVILEHLAVVNSRLLLWGKMPPAHFLDLLEAMRGCGFAVVCCHENHAILRLPKENTMDICEDRRKGRNRQRELLRERETELNGLVASRQKEEFFRRIKPLLDPLRPYIKRRLRVAYAEGEIRTEVYTSTDILDQAVLRAYDHFSEKPKDLTLEQWLYRVANDVLEDYLRKRKSFEKRRRSLEDLRVKELRTLDEIVTADAEGEIWLPEELDDSEYYPAQFTAPAETFRNRIENDVCCANITIIEGNDASQYGIGMVSARIAEAIIRDEHLVMPIGFYHQKFGVALSLPVIVGRPGVLGIVEPAMTREERDGLQSSADKLKQALAPIQIG